MAEAKLKTTTTGTNCMSPLMTLAKPMTSGVKADRRFNKQDLAISKIKLHAVGRGKAKRRRLSAGNYAP